MRFQREIDTWEKLGFLNPHNLTKEESLLLPIKYGTRIAVMTPSGKIILIKVTSENYSTLVGGGIEEGESIDEGMIRECLEESGYTVSLLTNLGYIELWRKKYRRFVFGFLVKAIGEPKPLNLTKEEIEYGHEVSEYSIIEAEKIIESDIKKTNTLASVRSLMFLREAKKYLENVVK